MARQDLKTFFGVAVIFFFTSRASCWTGPTISMEQLQEHVQQLTTNYIQLKGIVEEKDVHLEAKIAQLQFRDHQHMDTTSHLEAKVARLEELVKLKDEQHKTLADKLARLELEFQIELKKDKRAVEKSFMVRTCQELRAADPTLKSEMYWIDPDGQGVGDDPIRVHCDMATGSTSVPHDSELPMEVDHCADPGCYSRAINYDASQRQMGALAEISLECHQSIKYECNYAPLEFNTVTYSWWNDREGKAQYFWAGSNSSVHTCQCGIDGNCIDPTTKCNCDATLPIPEVDGGVITDKEILPITRLNFGRTPLETSSGVHTLGRFQCSGQVAVTGMPKSCENLWRIGHTLSGLYSVMGTTMVESVYCDFTKLPSDSGFQTWIGYADVKSAPAYFYVQRNGHYDQTKTPIPFDVEKLNAGGAFNKSSGKFMAPVKGKYFFTASGIPSFPATSSARQIMDIGLFKNGGLIGSAHSDEMHNNTATRLHETFSLQSTLELQKGDEIWLEIILMTIGADLHGNGFLHFSGLTLEEEISLYH